MRSKKLVAAFLAALAFLTPAIASAQLLLTGVGGFGVVKPLMQVATSTYQPGTLTATGSTSVARKAFIARDNISTIQLGVLTSYRSAATGIRTPIGAAEQVQILVEYPAGTTTPVTFSGNATPTLADNALSLSDPIILPVAIPNGATAWLQKKCFAQCPATASTPSILNASLGEGAQTGTSGIPSLPLSSVPTSTVAQDFLPVTLILSHTNVISIAGWGTSRTIAVNDTTNSVGDRGSIFKVLGPSFAYANLGISGDWQSTWLADPMFDVLNQYFTHVGPMDVTNNIRQLSATPAGLLAFDNRMMSHLKGKAVFRQTIEPNATGTFTSTGGQTPTGVDPAFTAWNQTVRAATDAPYLEVANGITSAVDSGLWAAPGGVAQTQDGLHANAAGTSTEVASGTILTSVISGDAPSNISFTPVNTSNSATFSTTAPKFGTGNLSGGSLSNYGVAATAPPYTVEIWFKTTTTGGPYTAFNMSTGAKITISAGALGGYGYGGAAFTASGTFNDGAWHMGAVVVTSATTGTLYADVSGTMTALATSVSGTTPLSAPGYTNTIGTATSTSLTASVTPWVGSLDEWSEWNYAKTQAQLQADYTASPPFVGTEAGLIALMHLDNAAIISGPAL